MCSLFLGLGNASVEPHEMLRAHQITLENVIWYIVSLLKIHHVRTAKALKVLL